MACARFRKHGEFVVNAGGTWGELAQFPAKHDGVSFTCRGLHILTVVKWCCENRLRGVGRVLLWACGCGLFFWRGATALVLLFRLAFDNTSA